MKYRDGLLAMVAVALSTVALAGVVYTDAYSHTAKAEASGVRALTEVAAGDVLACADMSADMSGLGDAARTVQQ